METSVPEAAYPVTFQKKEAELLGKYLHQRQCVNFVGMKRVGISHFLRFFLARRDIISTYITPKEQHLFITVDLHDLVERELYPFWTLTLKRIVDATEDAALPTKVKKTISTLFDRSIQSQDLFVVIDSIRRALVLLVESGIYPTIFFLRFDRLKDKFNPSFFDNLEGLRDAAHGKLAYVFTSYRRLTSIFPFAKTLLSVLAHTVYAKPIGEKDMEIIFNEYCSRYDLTLPSSLKDELFVVVGGYVQYLQLALIILTETEGKIASKGDLLKVLLADERIALQSEELWESLTKEEKKILLDVLKGRKISKEEKERNFYLWDTGFVYEKNDNPSIFSQLFERFLQQVEQEESKKHKIAHLTRKENLLFNVLKSQLGEICERDKIIEAVWPEYQEFGVSDWAIDRLVARVRVKLREQNSPYEIVTVRTRGYRLTMAKE